MFIIRDGLEIELTRQEVADCYYEYQHSGDLEDIFYMLKDNDDESCKEMLDHLKSDPDFADRVAYRFRKYIDDDWNEDFRWDCMRDAYYYIDKM